MPDEPEESFTVRDRRRFHADDAVAEAAATESNVVPAAAPTDVPIEFTPHDDDSLMDPEGYAEDGYPSELPDVYSVLAMFLGELRNLAWLRMGLVANPGSGQIERDLPQAKVAIDTVAYLASKLEPVVPPEERLPLKALVSDLQINFVEQSKRGA
jgi:hypothetical protein